MPMSLLCEHHHRQQALVLVGQALTASSFQESQDAQGHREQVDQACRPLVTRHRHGRERERLAFQPAKPPLQQIFFARRQHGRRKLEGLLRMIGHIDTPSQAARGGTHRSLIHLAVQMNAALDADRRRVRPRRAHRTRDDLLVEPQLDQPLNPVRLEERLSRLLPKRLWPPGSA